MLTRKQIEKVSRLNSQLSNLKGISSMATKKPKPNVAKLKALTASAKNKGLYTRKGPDSSLLERFTMPEGVGVIVGVMSLHIEAPEFTSLCPITGQPDFATIVIDYVPGVWCVESKSLKLYLGSFRNHGCFHEGIVQRIANDLIRLLAPIQLGVTGEFTPRGGIPFWPTVQYVRPPAVKTKDDQILTGIKEGLDAIARRYRNSPTNVI